MTESAFFFFGMALLDNHTVVPALLEKLGATERLVGLATALRLAGLYLPQLLVAHRVQGRRLVLPFLLRVAAAGRLLTPLLPLALWLFAAGRPSVALWIFIAFSTLFWLSDGCCWVPWTRLCAKSTPPRRRGRLFGTMQMAAGLASIAGALLVGWFLSERRFPFPSGYVWLAALSSATFLFTLVLLARLRERDGDPEDEEAPAARPPGLADFLRGAPQLLSRSAAFRGVAVTQLLLGLTGMAGSFYVLYALKGLGAGQGMVGRYTLIGFLGGTLAGPVWGWLCERFGNRAAIRGVALVTAAVPLSALTLSPFGPVAYGAVFFLLGTLSMGPWIGFTSYLLERFPPSEQPRALGLFHTLNAVSLFAPLLGGFLAERAGYPVLFGAAAAVGALAAASTLRLPR